MPATNLIGPIPEGDWNALIAARGAIKLFEQDTTKYAKALDKYKDIYKDTLYPYISYK